MSSHSWVSKCVSWELREVRDLGLIATSYRLCHANTNYHCSLLIANRRRRDKAHFADRHTMIFVFVECAPCAQTRCQYARNEFFSNMRENITRIERNNNNIKLSLSQTDERTAGRMYSIEWSAERTLNPKRITLYSLPSFDYTRYGCCECDSDDNAIITDFSFLVEEPNETEFDAGSTNLLPLSLCMSHLLGHASHFARRLCNRLFLIFPFYHSNTDVDSSALMFYFCFFSWNQNSFYKHTMNDVLLRAPMATNIEKTCLHTSRQHLTASSFSF